MHSLSYIEILNVYFVSSFDKINKLNKSIDEKEQIHFLLYIFASALHFLSR